MRIDGLFNGQSLNQANVLDILNRLNIGDVIKAKVLEMTSGELMLKLFDGTVFKAAATSDIDTRPGELLELAVSGKSDGSITLEAVKKNIKSESSQNEIKKLLISMDIPPKPVNIELAGEFKAAGVKILPEIFKNAAELISKFSELTPEKAVFLAAKDIKPGEGSIDTLVKLLEGRLKLGKQLDELQNVIIALNDNITAKNITVKTAGAQTTVPASPLDTQPQSAVLLQAVSEAASKADSKTLPMKILPTPPSNRQDMDAANIKLSNSQDMNAVNIKLNTVPAQPEEPIPATTSRPRMLTAEVPDEDVMPVPARAVGTAEQPQEKFVPTAGIEDRNEKSKPVTEQSGKSGFKSPENEARGLEKLKDSFKSMFVRTDSEELKSELDVKKLYKDLAEKLDVIKSTASYSGLPGADEITARVNNLNEGMKLLNQINSSTAYYQIPLNISGFNTTGELYVMKREQSRKRINPKDVTMFISLDTQNIGRIETVIDIKGKNVSMNLRAEEKQIIDFIKENCKELYKGLVDKGYRLVDIRYRLIEDAANPVNMEQSIKKGLVDGHYSVDMRI